MTNTVDITFRMPDFGKAAATIEANINGLVAATMQEQRAQIFDTEGRFNGRPGWPPLRCRDGQILKHSGTLSKSIGPQDRPNATTPGHAVGTIVRIGGGVVTIGTTIAYAPVHNFSADIVCSRQSRTNPRRPGALAFQCHGKTVFRRKVHIPARPFADWTKPDVEELRVTVENYVLSVMEGLQ